MAQPTPQESFAPRKDDIDMSESHTIVHQPKGADAVPENGHGVPTLVAEREANPVLEEDAATQGTWTAYVKTKQFWIAMLLGQSECLHSVFPFLHALDISQNIHTYMNVHIYIYIYMYNCARC